MSSSNTPNNIHPVLANLREDYRRAALNEQDLHANPIAQFRQWFSAAQEAKLPEPNAMTLATVDTSGQPSARIVLLKDLSEEGFIFYTNYESRKGSELAAQPKAALLFCWLELERQVRIEGTVNKAAPAASDAYFASRPRGSQIGAWASPQSAFVSKEQLEASEQALSKKYPSAIPRPPHWGGYCVRPHRIEFWQGRSSRLHDRLVYTLNGTHWSITRLAP